MTYNPIKEKLVLSTQAGIVAMNPETETFEPLSPLPDVRSLIENYIYVTFHIDRNDNIWLANGNGGITWVNLLTGKRQNYRHDLKKEHNIGRFKVLHIFENHLGELFFSTAGSGLFKYEPETDSFFRFAMEDNLLMSNYCYYVAESPSHELFVLHNRGISCLNSEKKGTHIYIRYSIYEFRTRLMYLFYSKRRIIPRRNQRLGFSAGNTESPHIE